MYQTSLIWVSFASEPEEQKKNSGGMDRDQFLQSFSELDCGIMAFAGEEMGERQLAHLCSRGLDQLFIAVAERGAPKPRHALDVLFALGVIDEYALSPLEDERPALAKGGELGVGVNKSLDITNGEVAEPGHGCAVLLVSTTLSQVSVRCHSGAPASRRCRLAGEPGIHNPKQCSKSQARG